MLTLRELQSGFCQSVTGDVADEILHLVVGDGLDPLARLSIYRNNVVTRLTETLSAAYPVVCRLVDHRFFAYAAERFLRDYLPTNGCLHEYGADFPSFLEAFPPAAEPKYLADVARLEWAVHCVRHGTAHTPVSIAALAGIKGDPSLFKLRLAPTVRFVSSPYAVDRIWVAHQEDQIWEELLLGSAGAQLQINGMNGLSMVNLARSAWEFRARLSRGEGLGTAVEAAMAASSDFDAPAAIASLFSDRIVIGVTAEPDRFPL